MLHIAACDGSRNTALMRTWLGSIFFVILGSFAVASGCGTTEPKGSAPSRPDDSADAGTGAASGNGGISGTGATSGGFMLGDGGGSSDGCPSTCEALNANCGFVTDTRCTGVVECGSCPDGQFCGGDGSSRCGTGASGDGGACSGPNCVSCVPKNCADQGFNCGPAGDTCGNKLDCGPSACAIPGFTCGGSGKPGVCGCTGACSQIPDCSASATKTTSVSGTVFDPAGLTPLYHVFVYVANNPMDPDLLTFKQGVTCDVCGATAAGSPLASDSASTFGTYTDTSGKFKLNNVPVGKGVTVVIQLGRWRRTFKIDVDKSCDDNPMPSNTFLMPSKQSQGNIPLIAMVTGHSDLIECTLRKMGIDGTEFTNPGGGGRVQFYLGSNGAGTATTWGERLDSKTPLQSALFAKDATGQAVINGYDMTILSCQGAPQQQSTADQTTLRNYAAAGGRVFTSHYSYSWLANNKASATAAAGTADNWNEVATWANEEGDRNGTANGHIDLASNPKGAAFQSWLEAVGASVPGSGIAVVNNINHSTNSISSVPGQTQQWLYRDGLNKKTCSNNGALTCSSNADCGAGTCNGKDFSGKLPLHFTYNTPVNLTEDLTKDPPSLQCGRVLFSDFHVQDANTHDTLFPSQCNTLPMNAQEKLLEYMLFDLGSCVPPSKACVPATTCPAGENCGYAPDGCGGLISCGVCPSGQSCGVGTPPVPNKCGKGAQTCTPKTCAAQGIECGPAADGCGAKIDSCGLCAAGDLCIMGHCTGVN